MTDVPAELDMLAAELALRVLPDDDAREARVLEASDPGFAAAVAAWDAVLEPLFDELAPVEPDAAVWPRIAAAVTARQPDVSDVTDNVVPFARRLGVWRAAAAGMTAIAASLALVIGLGTSPEAPVTRPASTELLIASIVPAAPGAGPPLAVVSYDRILQSLVVTPAALDVPASRARELWVVPASGKPRSLGLLASASRRIVLAEDLAREFAGVPTLAISDEQPGGSRTGAPVGPVIATGKLLRV